MGAGTSAMARPSMGESTATSSADVLARWLLIVVALDLVLTRLIVRLAIFVPKGEPWASVGGVLGRLAAISDVLVPIVGLLLLGALLLQAGRSGDRAEQLILVVATAAAVGGLALVQVAPTHLALAILGLVIVAVAVLAGVRIAGTVGVPRLARLGVVALAAAVAIAAMTPILSGHLHLVAVGQSSFMAGALLVALAGLADVRQAVTRSWPLIVVAVVTAAGIMIADARAPATFAQLTIWSVGLTGALPTAAVALTVGLAIVGLPALYRRAPTIAVGSATVLLAGYGLAASGLVLAGVLGLVIATSQPGRTHGSTTR